MRILVVEDDPTTSVLLEKALREEGHTVVVERNGAAAVDIARSHHFEAIVLDVLLPGLDGFGVTKRLRQNGCQTPILMLTALDTDKDVIRGLNLGSDDYLTKPFALDVFFARLKAVARRRSTPMPTKLSLADLELDPASREVRRGGRLLSLTRTEYNLLELLLRSAGRAVLREQLIDTIWGFGTEVESNTLDAFISSLRSKVEPPGSPKLIHTPKRCWVYTAVQGVIGVIFNSDASGISLQRTSLPVYDPLRHQRRVVVAPAPDRSGS